MVVDLMGGPYKYPLPKLPTDEKKILFYDKKKENQFWRIPIDLRAFPKLSVREKMAFVDQERDRWLHGCWFFNNGEPTYITGMHYDHMVNQYVEGLEGGKWGYLDSQRHDFYFRDLVRTDPKSYGGLFLKPRRYGMTGQEVTEDQYIAMRRKGQHVGMVSDEREKTRDTLFRPLVDSIFKRPKYTRPKMYTPGKRLPKRELLFSDGLVEDMEEFLFDMSGYLGGWITPKGTTVKAYDGFKLHKLTVDEIWKWQEINPEEFWGVHKKCLEDGGRIIGKASFLSTMGDSDDCAEAVECGIRMWHGSDPEIRNKNGHTATGLYRWFIDAVYTMREYKDKYGFINVDQASDYIANELADFEEGTKEYVFYKRRMPRCPEDALSSAEGKTHFDNTRIVKRLNIIKAAKKKPYVRGEFEVKRSGKVEWVPNDNGKWKMAWLPKRNNIVDATNRFRIIDGKKYQPVNPEGAIGYDGINFAHVDTTSGNLSRTAIVVKQKLDYFGNKGAGRINASCIWRPEDPSDGDYELYKACLFF